MFFCDDRKKHSIGLEWGASFVLTTDKTHAIALANLCYC